MDLPLSELSSDMRSASREQTSENEAEIFVSWKQINIKIFIH